MKTDPAGNAGARLACGVIQVARARAASPCVQEAHRRDSGCVAGEPVCKANSSLLLSNCEMRTNSPRL